MPDQPINVSVTYSPELRTVRHVKVNDAALPTKRVNGINVAEFDEIAVQVILKNSCTAATITPYYWSPEKGGFIADSIGVTIVAGANGLRKIIRVGHHESVFLEVSGIAGGAATDLRVYIEAAGIPVFDRVG